MIVEVDAETRIYILEAIFKIHIILPILFRLLDSHISHLHKQILKLFLTFLGINLISLLKPTQLFFKIIDFNTILIIDLTHIFETIICLT